MTLVDIALIVLIAVLGLAIVWRLVEMYLYGDSSGD
jgi:hypothetical protein